MDDFKSFKLRNKLGVDLSEAANQSTNKSFYRLMFLLTLMSP